MHLILMAQALALLTVANVAPLFAKRLLCGKLAGPLDGGLLFPDGRPLWGPGKTIGGFAMALAFTPLCAELAGLSWRLGLLAAIAAMTGDLLSSFVKRRLALSSGAMAPGLDQVPESLLPMLALWRFLPFSAADIVLVCVIFLAGELIFARILFHLHLRERPY